MVITTYRQWEEWSGTYGMLPLVCSYPLESDRLRTLSGLWEQASPHAFVLESGKAGRYSFLGLEAVSTIAGKGDEAVIRELAGGQSKRVTGSPLEVVKEWMAPLRTPVVPDCPKFAGGCVGFWGYDVVRSIERLPQRAEDDLQLPDYAFMMVRELWAVDHEARMLYCIVHTPVQPEDTGGRLLRKYEAAELRAEEMKGVWDHIMRKAQPEPDREQLLEQLAGEGQKNRLAIEIEAIPGLRTTMDQAGYMRAVEKIQDYIGQGDVFQVNLSVRQSRELRSRPESVYEWLRAVNPSPYMGMLRFPEFQLVSGSPELLVKLENGKVETRPIAGTRPRGADQEEDDALAGELIAHEKERAEHIMMVDLQRNDLGRISRYGTVKVRDLMVIEYYSHVMHIVSHVEGELMEGRDAFDVIAATLPGGTITGAPKIRTMEIIEELEPVRRGPYTGAMGWIDFNGNMEFNIIIRTLVVKDGIGHIQAGAGIVIDSVPEREYIESLNKAKALWKAIQLADRQEELMLRPDAAAGTN